MPIRLATAADAPAIAAIYRPFCESSHVSFETTAPDAAEMAARINKTLQKLPWLVDDDDGIAGYAYASVHRERLGYRWSADAAVYIHPAHHRRGAGSRLYRTLFPLLQRLGYYRVFAGIALPNPGSVGLHQSLGFSLVGVYRGAGFKNGAWRDVGWWQLDLRPAEGVPAEPASWPEFAASGASFDLSAASIPYPWPTSP
jgi:phosphinothricin acetyltransferase